MDTEKLKTTINKNIKYLQDCTNFTNNGTMQALCELQSVLEAILDKPEIQKLIGEYVSTLNLSQLFTKVWESLSDFILKWESEEYSRMCYILDTVYIGFTDISSKLSAQLGRDGCLGVLINALETLYQDEEQNITSDTSILRKAFLILGNSIQNCSDNIPIYRKADAVPILKNYLAYDDPRMKEFSLRILAYIVDEEESGILQTSNGGVAFIYEMVKDASSTADHREHAVVGSRASVLELLRCLNKLAVNDTNKTLISDLGGITVFTRMLSSDFSEDEQLAAVGALWNLAFIEKIRKSPEMQASISCEN